MKEIKHKLLNLNINGDRLKSMNYSRQTESFCGRVEIGCSGGG